MNNELGSLISFIYSKLREDEANPDFWSKEVIISTINSGYKEFCGLLDIQLKEVDITLREGKSIYSINDAILELLGVYGLIQKGYSTFDISATGTPKYWDKFGLRTMKVSPTPTSADEGNKIKMLGRSFPGELEENEDALPNDQDLLLCIVYYVLWNCFDTEGDGQNMIKATYYSNKFEERKRRLLLKIENSKPEYVMAGGR